MRSRELFQNAQKIIPGGVNSPVRAYKNVDCDPPFIKAGKGPYLYDVDGNQYIDYVGSWGPLIVGHAHPYIVETVQQALANGFSFGAPTELEVALATKITQLMPAIEKIRFVSSGTEAAMSAIRVARGFTKRNKIIKFIGCYHGHADHLLVAAGSGGLTLGQPNSSGVPSEFVSQTLLAHFNDINHVESLFTEYGEDIAAVIVEPVAGNMNCVLPQVGFLQKLRKLCDQHQSLLIFDEVITGFRVALGGAQAFFDVRPDLTILGKIIGGGFPAAAFGGRAEVMDVLAPIGTVYQAGTLSGNPIAMSAGLATLTLLTQANFYTDLSKKTETLTAGIKQCANKAGIPILTNHIGGMFGLFFTEANEIHNEQDVQKCNQHHFKIFFQRMLKEKIYLAPSPFEIGFISSTHNEYEISKTLFAFEKVCKTFYETETWRGSSQVG